MWFEVLVEGASDVPAIRDVLTRRLGLVENETFRIHAHRGRGTLPNDLLGPPDKKQQTLLHQLPAKLRGFSYLDEGCCVVVVVDVDNDPCNELLAQLKSMLARLPKRPARVLFRLAIEETESWFIADHNAVLAAFPRADIRRLRQIAPDACIGAWEVLAAAIGVKSQLVTGADKFSWAEKICPHLNLADPGSPSLWKFIIGIEDMQQEILAGD